jgi:transcriptional regulator with XRE-family HTH domain
VKVPRLKEWRETRGETQVSLAEKAGVTQYTVLRAEHGENMRPSTARRLAEVLGITVSDLQEKPPVPRQFAMVATGKAEATDTGQRSSDESLMSRPEVWEWLLKQGHVPSEDFLALARELSNEEELDWAIRDLHETRDGIIEGLKDPSVRKTLFGPVRPKGLSEDARKREVLRPVKLAWKLEWDIRSEYLARETALVNYGRELFVEGRAEDYLVREPVGERDRERHELMLEERRRRVLEEKYAAQLAAV